MTQLQEISAAPLPSAFTRTKKTIPNPADWAKQEYRIYRRAPKYFRTHQIHNDSLMLMGSHELETLLNNAVRSKHKKNLHRRVSRLLSKCLISPKFRKEHWNQNRLTPTGFKEPLKLQKTRKKLKFLTIVHAVTSLDVATALEQAALLKAEIIRLCKMVEGVACIGTIEVEVV